MPCATITGLLDFTISIWAKCNDCSHGISPNLITLISICNDASGAGNHFSLLN